MGNKFCIRTYVQYTSQLTFYYEAMYICTYLFLVPLRKYVQMAIPPFYLLYCTYGIRTTVLHNNNT